MEQETPGKGWKHIISRSAASAHCSGAKGELSKEKPQGAKPWDEDRVQGLPAQL